MAEDGSNVSTPVATNGSGVAEAGGSSEGLNPVALGIIVVPVLLAVLVVLAMDFRFVYLRTGALSHRVITDADANSIIANNITKHRTRSYSTQLTDASATETKHDDNVRIASSSRSVARGRPPSGQKVALNPGRLPT